MHPPSEDVHQTGSSPLVGGGEQAVRAVNRAGSSDGVSREDPLDDAGNGGSRSGVPNGIRPRVLALKGPRPGPLDDGDGRKVAHGPAARPDPPDHSMRPHPRVATPDRERRRAAMRFWSAIDSLENKQEEWGSCCD